MKNGGMKKGFKYPPNIKQIWFTNGERNIQLRYNIEEGYSVPDGFWVGRTMGASTTKGKKWYNNGKINKLFIEGTQPDGFELGMLAPSRSDKNNPNYKGVKEKNEQRKKEYDDKIKYIRRRWYTNGDVDIICFEGEQPEGFILGVSDSNKQNRKGKNVWSKGSKQKQSSIEKRKLTMANRTSEQKVLSKEKEFNTKLKNETLGNTVSQSELECFKFLQCKFPEYTVKNQYFDKERYPHFCDIYIEELDLFIELNLFFTHGNHMPLSEEEAISIDNNMPNGWNGVALSDYNKYLEAQRNHLNYLVFYTLDEFYNLFNKCTFNKITKIDIKDSQEYVYDIGVKDNDNMVLSNGLIVHNCKPYQAFKNALYENRFELYNSKRLIEEITDLERNINTGKVDHPPNGHKDVSDAVCGSMFTCSKYAEEFAYDYGELLDTTLEVSEDMEEDMKTQIKVNFDEELRRALSDSYAKPSTDANDFYADFGFGKAEDIPDDSFLYINSGIIV